MTRCLGKVALVTGGSRGLRGTARALKEGATSRSATPRGRQGKAIAGEAEREGCAAAAFKAIRGPAGEALLRTCTKFGAARLLVQRGAFAAGVDGCPIEGVGYMYHQ